MINLSLKPILKKLHGAVTLIVTTILIAVITLIIIFAANHGVMIEKITANQSRNNQAFEAAQAGLEFGIPYLLQNKTAILSNQSGGLLLPYTNSSITNVILANNSKFDVVYSNPIANNFTLILITSTGTSDDSSSTRVVSQLVKLGSLLSTAPTSPLTSKGSITMGGNTTITNNETSTTIQSSSSVSISGSAKTVLNSVTNSTAGNIKSDIQQNSASLMNMTQSDFFASYFGVPVSVVQNSVAHLYTNSSTTNYNSLLNGLTGTSIWINQTAGSATLTGSTTIGSSTNPVLLIVNGDLNISGNITIYGFVYVSGTSTATTDITGNVSIIGGLVSSENFNMTGNIQITYNSTVLNNLQNQAATNYFAKVPGSWKDF